MARILVVEDEPSSAELLRFVLQQEGYQVLTAANGREALDALQELSADLVLCDLMMPIMDGRELCQTLRDDPRFHSIPFVLMSAAPDSTIARLAEENCTVAEFLRKPLDLDRLTTTVRKLATT